MLSLHFIYVFFTWVGFFLFHSFCFPLHSPLSSHNIRRSLRYGCGSSFLLTGSVLSRPCQNWRRGRRRSLVSPAAGRALQPGAKGVWTCLSVDRLGGQGGYA